MTKQIYNPYLPSYEYVPDGEPRVFGDRLYVYGSHDKFNGEDFCLNDYVCWSTPISDLTNWRYEGVIYRKSDDPKYKPGKFQHMNAPDVIKGKDGKFYLYYAFGADFFCSVAVGDSPVGPFKFYGRVSYPNGKIVGKKRKDPFCFDPSIFIDDDGKIYLYVGFSPVGLFRRLLKLSGLSIDGGYGMELEDDMKTVKKESIKLLIPGEAKAKNTFYQGHGFYEASSMRKINNKYYYVYSSILSHELCYATSDSPLGDFTYKGTIVSIGDIGYKGNVFATNQLGNTHGGMVEINNQHYIFYHRQTNKQKCARQDCAEKIYFDEKGDITQVEVTSCGLNNGLLLGEGSYEARIACNLFNQNHGVLFYKATHEKDENNIHAYFTQHGEDREDNPNQYIANITDGTVVGFKYFNFSTIETISITFFSKAKGKIIVALDVEAKEKICEMEIEPCSGQSIIEAKVQKTINKSSPLYFIYTGEGSWDFIKFDINK